MECHLAIKLDADADICYNMDELQKQDTKWKKAVTKDHILYESLYIKCPEQVNP